MKLVRNKGPRVYQTADYQMQVGESVELEDAEADRLKRTWPNQFEIVASPDSPSSLDDVSNIFGRKEPPKKTIEYEMHAIEGVDVIIPICTPLKPLHEVIRTMPAVMRPKIVVINNGDHSSKAFRKEFPEVRVIDNEVNRGWVGGLQQGLRFCSSKYVVFMNSDVILPENCDDMWHTMVSAMESNPKLATISTMRWEGGTESTVDQAAQRIKELREFMNITLPDTPAQVRKVCSDIQDKIGPKTVFKTNRDVVLFMVLLRREAYDKVGGFNSAYGLGYVDDADLTRRLNVAGYEHAVCASYIINHSKNTTGGFKAALGGGFTAYHQMNRQFYNHYWGGKPQLPVLYTTWNRIDYTKKTLPKLLEDPELYLIIAIDNGSTDGTQKYLREMERKNPGKLRVILNLENRKVAGTMNQFFDMVRPLKYFAKVDNDTMVEPGVLTTLWTYLKLHKMKAVQAANQTYYPSGNLEVEQKTHLGGTAIVCVIPDKPIPVTNYVLGWTGFQRNRWQQEKVLLGNIRATLLDADEEGNKISRHPSYDQFIDSQRRYTSEPSGSVPAAKAEKAKGIPAIVASNQRLHVMCAFNEAHRYLKECIEASGEFADKVLLIDDCSTDETADVARAAGAHVIKVEKNMAGQSENMLRSFMWQCVDKIAPDWVFLLDADEMFEKSAPARLKEMMDTCKKDVHAFRFPILHMWGDTSHYRTDGQWGGYTNIRLVKFDTELSNNFPSGRWHSGNVPKEYRSNAKETNVHILHLGYVRERDRVEKYLKHMQRGGNEGVGIATEHLVSILDDNPKVSKWGKGLPVHVDSVGARREIQLDWSPTGG